MGEREVTHGHESQGDTPVRLLSASAPRRTPGLSRRLRWSAAAALSLVLAAGVTTASVADDAVPSEEDVAQAQRNAEDRARDVSAVQADLVLANEELRQTAITAAQAAEAYNGARWQADEARKAARAATAAAAAAEADVQRQQEDYSDALVRGYEISPSLQGFAAVVGADGIETMIDRTTTMQNAEDALDGAYDAFRAAATLADVASRQAEEALADAERLEEQAEQARADAAAAETQAAAAAQAIAASKTVLIAELADLQGISVRLAERRQSALEQAAAEAAAAAAQQAAQQAAEQEAAQEAAEQEAADLAAQQAADQAAQDAATQASSAPAPAPTTQPTTGPTTAPTTAPTSESTTAPTRTPSPSQAPTPTPTRTPTPTAAAPTTSASTPSPTTPAPTTPSPTPPAPSTPAPTQSAPTAPAPAPPPAGSGVAAAIAFATAQIGDAYEWGAAGPDAWDCSGLTAGAWAKGGKYLPHYSVAQYTGSTRITAAQLVPGDLVFWGSSSSPSSIYHVGLYVGGGQMIHAPRTGRPVVKESIYSWTTPNFFARP
jgi:cell wall-associated NlpC family hydrolase